MNVDSLLIQFVDGVSNPRLPAEARISVNDEVGSGSVSGGVQNESFKFVVAFTNLNEEKFFIIVQRRKDALVVMQSI